MNKKIIYVIFFLFFSQIVLAAGGDSGGGSSVPDFYVEAETIIKRAKKMISKLAKSSVDCVKFQLGDPEKIFSKDSFKANYQKNTTFSFSQ